MVCIFLMMQALIGENFKDKKSNTMINYEQQTTDFSISHLLGFT